jgi:hypothetical protein
VKQTGPDGVVDLTAPQPGPRRALLARQCFGEPAQRAISRTAPAAQEKLRRIESSPILKPPAPLRLRTATTPRKANPPDHLPQDSPRTGETWGHAARKWPESGVSSHLTPEPCGRCPTSMHDVQDTRILTGDQFTGSPVPCSTSPSATR